METNNKQDPLTSKIPSVQMRELLGVSVLLAVMVLGYHLWNNRSVLTTAPLATTLSHELPDGSEIVLNDGSSIKYERSTWEEDRQVLLLGEAYCRVQEGSIFQVKTANGTARVLGTHFNVRSWGDNFYVECYEGKVQVIGHREEMVLSAHQSVNIVAGQMDNKQSISHQQPLWTIGSSRFYQESFTQVLKELERQYAVQVYAPSMGRTFSGTFRHDDLEEALIAICKPMQLAFEVDGRGKVVTIYK